MFRNDRQACEALQMLLGTVRLEHLWTKDGPTRAALRYRDANGGPLSSGERIILLAAFDLWNQSGGLKLAEVPGSLDTGRARTLLSLLSAITNGSDAVEQWLTNQRRGYARTA